MNPEDLKKQEEEKKKFELQKKLLKELTRTESFQTWRDFVAKPILEQLDNDLMNPFDRVSSIDKKTVFRLEPGELRAKIMYRNLVQELFYNIFENLDN